MSQSGWGKGLAQTNQDFLAQYQAQNEQKIAIMRAQAEERERLLREAEEQARLAQQAQLAAQQAQQQTQQPVPQQGAAEAQVTNPLLDENSNFRKYLAANNIDFDLYMGKDKVDENGNVVAKGLTKIERDREIVTPFIESMWNTEVSNNPTLQTMSSAELAKVKQDFTTQRKRAYGANFDEDYDNGVDGWDRTGSLLNSGVSGVVGLLESANHLIGGLGANKWDWYKENIYDNVKSGLSSVQGGLAALDDEQRNQVKEYAAYLLENKEVEKLAKLAKDYPTLVADLGIQLVGGAGGVGAIAKGGGKLLAKAGAKAGNNAVGRTLSKAGNAWQKDVAVTMGAIDGGATAYQTAKADGTEDGLGTMAATAGGAALGGAISKVLNLGGAPTVEQAIGNVLSRSAPSALSEGAKKAAQKVLDKHASGTALGNKARWAYNTGKGAVGSGGKEFIEEAFQSGTATGAGHLADGTLTDKEIADTLGRAGTDGLVGTVFGTGLGLARNSLNRYGNANASQLAREQKAQADAQAAAQIAKDAQIKQGVWQDANGNTLPDFTEDDVALAQFYAQRNADLPNLETEYGKDSEAEYTADYDDAHNASLFNNSLNNLRDEIVNAGKGGTVQGVPQDIVDATTELSNLGTAQAKIQKLQEWAKNTGNAELEAKAGALAGKVVADYDYDSSGNYTNTKTDHGTTVETAIQKWQNELTGKTSPITDLNAELDALAQSQPDLADPINRYKKAIANNHHKTASKLAADFERAVDRKIHKNRKNPQQPAIDPALGKTLNKVSNSRAVDTIVKAMGRRVPSSASKWRSSQDPIAELRNVANSVGAIDHTVLTDIEADEVQAHLNNVLDEWEKGNFVDIGDTPNNLIAKVRNTVK